MSGRLIGKTAVVTGAGQGIGRAIALHLVREGCRVWATSRTLEPLRSLEDQRGLNILKMDVSRLQEVAAAAERIGAVDVLVNCAGYVAEGSLLECSGEELERSLDINLRGAWFVTRAFVPGMLERKTGSIVNIASVLSSITSAPRRFAYSVTKAALIGLTKSVAVDFAGNGIRCNAVCPGAVETPGLESRIAAASDPAGARAAFIRRHKLGRLGTADEVAEACVFLASEESGFMTGQLLVLDGGMTL
jgi:2-keto-3-deoxy-L-fuconate dehydrogenase